MALILHIDTAVQSASVCLGRDGIAGQTAISQTDRDAAGWLHPAIQRLLQQSGTEISQLEAVAVSAGPGSYTGLRVGMATAKGLCYALDIPLIAVNTLRMMAAAAAKVCTAVDLLCPMIDARRMEVFTALYKPSLEEFSPTESLILAADSFTPILQHHRIAFFGNGSEKFQSLARHSNASFAAVTAGAADAVTSAADDFAKGRFADLAYAEPFYGKSFHSTLPKKDLLKPQNV